MIIKLTSFVKVSRNTVILLLFARGNIFSTSWWLAKIYLNAKGSSGQKWLGNTELEDNLRSVKITLKTLKKTALPLETTECYNFIILTLLFQSLQIFGQIAHMLIDTRICLKHYFI